MFFRNIFLPILISFTFFSLVYALEIPISGAIKRDSGITDGIVFVDMEKVFQSHPMTERLKNDIKKFAQTRKSAIENLVKDYENLQKEYREVNLKITAIESQKNNDSLPNTENTEKEASENINTELNALLKQKEVIYKKIEEKKFAISDLSKRTKNEIAAMEEKNSMIIMKDIESVLAEISRISEAEIIMDKMNVLFGSENCEDITDAVIKKLEGR